MSPLIIKGIDQNFLSVDLIDILDSIPNPRNLHWAILWLSASGDLGDNKSILEFENFINNSKNSIIYNWDELKSLAIKFDQVKEILLIGSINKQSLKKYETDDEMFKTCDYSIELIDASYWILNALNIQALEVIKMRFPGSEYQSS